MKTAVSLIILIIAFIVSALFMMAFFENLPSAPIEARSLAIDWQQLHPALRNGVVRYFNDDSSLSGLFIPPWAALFVLPLGWLSLRASWGLLVFATLVIEIVSVPRVSPRWLYYAAILLLVVSWVSLRHAADGNFEGLIIAGVCLSVWAYRQRNPYWLALGVLLTSAKPQLTLLFLLVLGVYVLQSWQPRQWAKTAGAALLVVVPTFLLAGSAWFSALFAIRERGSIMDVSMSAALNRVEVIPAPMIWFLLGVLLIATLFIAWKTRPTLSREKAGMLVAASLLLAPYSAGNSVLSVLAIGVIPLFLKRPLVGLILIMMVNAMAFFGFFTQAYYTTFLLLVIWGVLARRVWQVETVIKKKSEQNARPDDSK